VRVNLTLVLAMSLGGCNKLARDPQSKIERIFCIIF
jgi:hypothetical protein